MHRYVGNACASTTKQQKMRTFKPERILTGLAGLLLLGLGACEPTQERSRPPIPTHLPEGAVLLSDTLVYSVDLVATDSLDTWSAWRLRHVAPRPMADFLLNEVYEGRLQAYDYFSNEPLSIEEVRRREQADDYHRDLVEEFQFEETWYYLPEEQRFRKEVHALVLAYSLYASDGSLRGRKPVLRIRLNTNND